MSEQELQMKSQTPASTESATTSEEAGAERTRFSSRGPIPPVAPAGVAQVSASERGFGAEAQTHQIADAGTSGAGQSLPHLDRIAHSFGPFGGAARGIRAHVGGEATAATNALGAQAYANGNAVAFKGSPDLHTAAHEAAHVVQQQGGVQLKGGVGEANDVYERNADAVADRVVAGESAQDLLEPFAGGAETKAVQTKAVQFLGTPLDQPLPETAIKPMYGEDDDQRRYSREQYETMWEADQGRELTTMEENTIRRGCIGITANNIAGAGNPLDRSIGNFADFDKAHAFMTMQNKELQQTRANPATADKAPPGQYILFAKLFWSNQSIVGDNSAPDDKAFLPDEKGRVDMSKYRYQAQPGYVNFDYGFWDDTTQSFWHANHMEYADPEKQKESPMEVYQSTKEKFCAGYTDFDRIVFGVAFATNYNPAGAAIEARTANGGGKKPSLMDRVRNLFS